MKLKSILLVSASLLMVGNSFGQSLVTTAGKKYVLLEEGTGTWCGYCPDGAEDIERDIEPNYPRAIIASFHNSDPMALTPDDFNTDYISPVGFPAATVDRNTFFGAVGQSRPWDSYVHTDTSLSPKFDVTLKSGYVSSDSTITIQLTAKCLIAGTGTWHINAYITEDSISSALPSVVIGGYLYPYGQGNYANCGCSHDYTYTACSPGDTSWFWHSGNGIAETDIPPALYSHMNVVMAVLGTNIYGDAAATFVNPTVGAVFTKTYTYHIPKGSYPNFTKVVGLVQKYGSTTSDRAIENVIQAKVRLMEGLSALQTTHITNTLEDFAVFPNPAKNLITVKGSFNALTPTVTTITVVNALGQTVFNTSYPPGGSLFGETIPLDNFSNGTYFMNISNSGASITRQFTVNK